MTNNKLDLRTEPKQLRARERVSAILDVTEKMLASGEKVTTSSIAKKADIPVGSVYRYFPDLNAIYRQLFENIHGGMLEKIKSEVQNLDPSTDWRQTLERCMEIMCDMYKAHPAFGDLLFLLENGELQESQKRIAHSIVNALAVHWRNGSDELSGTDPHIVARIVIGMSTANELNYFLEKDPETRSKLYTEWTRAIGAYLDIYLKS